MEDRHDTRYLGGISIHRSRINGNAMQERITMIITIVACLVSMQCVNAQTCNDVIITAPDPIQGEKFGKAMDVDGTTLVVGAPGRVDGQSPLAGRVFVFEWINGTWQYQATMTSENSRNGDNFGTSVAMDDGVIVVGSSRALDDRGVNTGAVFIYEQPADGWHSTSQPTFVLHPRNGSAGDMFGAGVGVSGNWIFVGAPQADTSALDSGVVYAFRNDGQSWSETQILARHQPIRREHFGLKIELQDNLAIIGAPNLFWHSRPGTVHAFVLGSYDHWDHAQTLTAGKDRANGDHFGRSLALSRGDSVEEYQLVIGSTGDDDLGEHSGSLYVFRLERTPNNGYQFVQTAKLIASDGAVGDHLGFSCAIYGDLIAGGAPALNLEDADNAGAVYVFKQTNSGKDWSEVLKLIAGCPAKNNVFGASSAFFVDPDSQGLGLLTSALGEESQNIPFAGVVHVIGP